MKTTSHLALTAFFYFTIAIARPAANAQQLVPFRLVQNAFAVVSVQIDGQGPFDFILDTGTDTTILDERLALSLGLVPIDRMTLTTPGGRQILTRSLIRSLALGPATLSDVEALVQDIPSLGKLDSRIRGIIGLNFFSHFNYVLDYRRHSLRFEAGNDLRDSTLGERVSLDGAGGRMLVQSEIRSGGAAKALLLLDSGVNEMVLFRKADHLQRLPSNMQLTVAGSGSDPQNISVGRIDALSIGKQRFYGLRFAFLPAGNAAARPEDGLLPTALFHVLYVNNREGFVVFNPTFETPHGGADDITGDSH